MSKMAELLNRSKLLAYSENVKLNIDGKELKGTLMKEAKGEDVNKIDIDSLMLKANCGSLENLKLKKQIADLQIIDYLCGNCDRHIGNMLYNFIDDNGNVVLESICGIDNDTCFGEILESTDFDSFISLNNMRVITADMAKRISELDEEGLKTLFYGYELNTTQLNSMKNRLEKLKSKIIKDSKMYEKGYANGHLIPGTIKIVGDQELEELSVEHDLAAYKKSPDSQKHASNLYSKIIKVASGEASLQKLQEQADAEYCKIAYELTSGSVGDMSELIARLESDNKWGKSSPGYDKMLSFMQQLKPVLGGFEANIAINHLMVDHCQKLKDIKTYLTKTLKTVNDYIEYKEGQKSSEEWKASKASRTKRRYYDAVACRNFLQNQLKKFETLDQQLDKMFSIENVGRRLKPYCAALKDEYYDSDKYKQMMQKRDDL